MDCTGHYFYSAVFQGNMALLGLLGVFIVFRLQSIDSAINDYFLIAQEYIRDFFYSNTVAPIPITTVTTEKLRAHLREWSEREFDGKPVNGFNRDVVIKAAQQLVKDDKLEQILKHIDNLYEQRTAIISQLWKPAFPIILTILTSFILLLFVVPIQQNECLKKSFFAIEVVLQLCTIISIMHYAWIAVRAVD